MSDDKTLINGYQLSRQWFDFCFENPEKASTNHTALYFFIIDKWNRMGQKKKFGLPTFHAMEALGVYSKNTYYKSFKFLEKEKFIKVVKASKNQHSAKIISLCAVSKFNAAGSQQVNSKKTALDVASIQQKESTYLSTGNITEQGNKGTKKQGNKGTREQEEMWSFKSISMTMKEKNKLIDGWKSSSGEIKKFTEKEFHDAIDKLNGYVLSNNKKYTDFYSVMQSWVYNDTVSKREKENKALNDFLKNDEDKKVIQDIENYKEQDTLPF